MDDDRGQRFKEGMRVITVSGAMTGALLIGVGSRVAMLLLRLTSPDHVRGVTSDDGFTIGEVTLGGTYNLLMLGAGFGIIGACAYRMVAPWLIGPLWFRRMTTGLASGAVVGSMLVHADGIDFTALQPTWFAIGLFVVLPAIFGVFIGVVVDAVGRPDSWTTKGLRKWLLPVIAVICFPTTIPVVAVTALVFGIWVLVSGTAPVQRIRTAWVYALAVRAVWLLVAVLGLVALVNDTRALT
jgi:hypothetical protein